MSRKTDVPPTEPREVLLPPPPRPAPVARAAVGERIAPDAFALDLKPIDAVPKFWFWIGLVRESPLDGCSIAGIAVQRRTERVGVNITTRTTVREGCAGDVLALSVDQIRKLADAIKHRVLRTASSPTAEPLPAGVVDPRPRPPRARTCALLRVPTAKELHELDKLGTTHSPLAMFEPQRGDVPLANYVFVTWIDEQNPSPRPASATLPLPVSEIGIMLPPANARPVDGSERHPPLPGTSHPQV